MAATRFAHLTLAVRDVQTTRDFFIHTLGWRDLQRPNNIGVPAVWLEIAPGQELHLLEIAGAKVSPFEAEFGRHVAFQYPVEDFDQLKKRLVEHGAELIAAERPTPFERFFFKEPNGYVFEIMAGERDE